MSISSERAKAEPKKTAGDHTSNVWSNYLFCPTLCRTCNNFYEEDSNWPYHCKANSTEAKSSKSKSEGYKQYDDCKNYKERERKETKIPEKTRERNYEENNKELKRQNRLLEEQTERKRRIEQERKEESERKKRIANEQKRKEEIERNTLQINDKFNSINDFAINNNMVRINICLPRVNETCLKYIKEDCKTLFLSFEKENLFLNAEDYNKLYTIRIPKKGIEKIIESTKIQNYLSNNKNDDMIAIKEPEGGFTIISPESFINVNQADDQNEGVKIDEAPFVIWLKKEELSNFVNIYNDYIKNKKRIFVKRKFLKICINTAIDFIFFLAVILIIINYSMGIAGYIIVPIVIGYTIFRIWKEATFIYNIFNGIWMIIVLTVGIRIIKEEYTETGNAIFEIILVIIMVMIPSLLKLIFKIIKAIFKKIIKLISR